MRILEQLEVAGKRVVVRVDWNVTLGRALEIVDDMRIGKTLPTIRYLLEHGATQVILLAHLGKPGGKAVTELSLAPVAKYAEKLLGEEIKFWSSVAECQSDTVSRVKMLENLRFWPGEEANDSAFAKQLANLGDVYVDEAFGEAHREVASNVGIPKLLPSAAGLWFATEVEKITRAVASPERPFVVVMGGAKVDDKIKLLETLSQKADVILLGGKLANEFVSRGMKLTGTARVITPVEGSNLLDIGEETQRLFTAEIMQAGTVVWNGPMGKVEDTAYQAGTDVMFAAVAETPAYTLVGGGDTLAALHDEGHFERIDHISTGGGAMLALIEKGTLPGIEALG